MSIPAADAITYGVQALSQYNPIFAVVGAALAAAFLAARNRSLDRTVWGVSALVLSWLIGDGLRVLARSRDLYDGIALSVGGVVPALGADQAGWLVIGVWAVCGFALGYMFPAWAGAFVGRRVTHGTGWLAAGSIAVGVSLAVSSIVAFSVA